MKEISKEQFKELYFKYCQNPENKDSGYTAEYWDMFFNDEKTAGMKFLAEDPATPQHTRMTIVTDFKAREYRLFFMTEQGEESLYGTAG